MVGGGGGLFQEKWSWDFLPGNDRKLLANIVLIVDGGVVWCDERDGKRGSVHSGS